MSRAIVTAFGRARLGRFGQGIAHTAPFLGRNTPLDMVISRIEQDAICLAFPFAVGESGGGFLSIPAHFAFWRWLTLSRMDSMIIPNGSEFSAFFENLVRRL